MERRIDELCESIQHLHRACGCTENDTDMQVYCVALLLSLADEHGNWIGRVRP